MTNNTIKHITDTEKMYVVIAKLERVRLLLEKAFMAIMENNYEALKILPANEARRYTNAINKITDKQNHLIVRMNDIRNSQAAA